MTAVVLILQRLMKAALLQEATCQILKRKLIAERKVRKASELWLRAELKSRVRVPQVHARIQHIHLAMQHEIWKPLLVQEDMESLFSAVREVTLSKSFIGSKSHRIRELLDNLQFNCSHQNNSCHGANLRAQCISQASSTGMETNTTSRKRG